jgi:PqqD family protein of HPr-rel-A system
LRSSAGPSGELRFAPADGLRLRHFEDEAVVFDPLSWDAHLLNPAAIAVLELLQAAPQSEDEVIAFLAEVLQPEEQRQAASHGKRLLDELQALGLVHAIESSLADR